MEEHLFKKTTLIRPPIYVAAPFSEAKIAAGLAGDLEDHGFSIVSTWHRVNDPSKPDYRTLEEKRARLTTNLTELASAVAVVAWTASGTPRATYGEIGRALAAGKPVIWIQGEWGTGGNLDDADQLVRIISTQTMNGELISATAEAVATASRTLCGRDLRQAKIADWAMAAFGVDEATSLPQRGLRLLEEALETYQAVGATPEMAHKLVDYVFSRPIGDLAQELGGVGVTVLALGAAAGISVDDEEEREVRRVLAKGLGYFAARNDMKNSAGLCLMPSGLIAETGIAALRERR